MSQTERLEIVVSERGAPTVARQISAIGDASERSAVQTNRLKAALYSLGAATGVAQLKALLDQYTNFTNRLRTATESAGKLAAVQQELFAISNRNRVDIATSAELYSRFAVSLRDVGTSTTNTLTFIDALTKAVGISGATTAEAKGALIQFSQALGANFRQSGQEIASLIDQLPVVIDAIASKLGITRGEIKKFAAEGKLSSAIVVDAILEMNSKWQTSFDKSRATIEQTFTVMKNRLLEVVGGLDETLGITETVNRALNFLTKNMEAVVGAAATLATVLTVTLARYAIDIVIGRLLDLLKLMVVTPLMTFAGGVSYLGGVLLAMSVSVVTATKTLAAFGTAGIAAAIGGIAKVGTVVVATAAMVRSAGLAGLTMGAGIAAGALQARLSLLTLINPLALIRGGITGLVTLLSGGLVAAFRTAAVAAGTLVTVIAGTLGLLANLAAIVLAVGVAMVTLGDKTKIAENSTVTYRDFALAAWEQIKSGFSSMVTTITTMFPSIGNAAKSAFGESGLSFSGFVMAAANGMDLLVAGFLATYDTIIGQWRTFPAAFIDFMTQAVTGAWDALVKFLYRAYDFLKDVISKVMKLDFSGIAAGGLDTNVEGAANRVGTAWDKALADRLKEGGAFGKAMAETLAQAERVSADRIKKEKETADALAAAQANFGQSGPNKMKSSEDDERKPKVFGDYLAELEREAQMGLAVGDSLRVLNEQRSIADKLRRDLTDAEKAGVENAVLEIASLERKRDLLTEIKGPTEEYNLKIQALNELYNLGKISLEEYNAKFFELRENFLNALPEATTFADGFAIQIEKMQLATRNGMASIGTDVAKIFGPGGQLINGIGDAVAQTLVFGKSFKEQIRQVAQSILSQLIGSLVKVGLNMALQAATNATQMTASTGMAVAQAGAITAAYAPAAAMSSLATGGANAAGATAGISSIFSLLASLGGSLFGAFGNGFSEGGYTGGVGVKQVAGVVHGQEFVINAAATKRHRSLLEAINAGGDPVASVTQAASKSTPNISITNQIAEAEYEVVQWSADDIEIIARRIVRNEAASVVASELRNPNSRVSKSVTSNTTAGRRR